MSKLVAFVIIIIFCLFTFLLLKEKSQPSPESTPIAENQKSSQLTEMPSISLNDVSYRYAVYQVANKSQLHLYPNFESQEKSIKLYTDNHCQVLVNGGFYSTDHKPLGWLVSESHEISRQIISKLLDGFIWMETDGRVFASTQVPQEAAIWGLQTGPLLIFRKDPTELKIISDKKSRRLVAGIDDQNNVWFLVIVGENSIFQGPLLASLPQVLLAIGKKETIYFTDAINLDGGSASVFITANLQIIETSFAGSYFCLKAN